MFHHIYICNVCMLVIYTRDLLFLNKFLLFLYHYSIWRKYKVTYRTVFQINEMDIALDTLWDMNWLSIHASWSGSFIHHLLSRDNKKYVFYGAIKYVFCLLPNSISKCLPFMVCKIYRIKEILFGMYKSKYKMREKNYIYNVS